MRLPRPGKPGLAMTEREIDYHFRGNDMWRNGNDKGESGNDKGIRTINILLTNSY